MNLKDLYSLNQDTIETIQQYDPSPALNELQGYLTSMRSAATPELRDTISQTLATVESNNLLIDTRLNLLPHIEYLEQNTDLKSVVGVTATRRVREFISNDPYFASSEIAEMVVNISNFSAFLRDTNKSLAGYGVVASEAQEPLLSFVFAGDSDVDTTGALIYKLQQIDKIMHGFARLTDDPSAFAKPRVRSLSKSSPLSIDIVSAAIDAAKPELHAYMVAKGIAWALSRIEQVQNIRLQHEELKSKKMVNDEVEAGFKKLEEESVSKDAMREFVTKELLADPAVTISNDGVGANEEIVSSVLASLKILLNLLENGTTAKVYIPVQASEDLETSGLTREHVDELIATNTALQKKITAQDITIKSLGLGRVTESAEAE